jgi:hypothetical protein
MGVFGPTNAQQLATIRANQAQIIIPFLRKILARLAPAETGRFNPPAHLVTTKLIEVKMSVMQLEVGQTAVGMMTFDEPTPPVDGAVVSDMPAVATIDLAADHKTWTCMALSVGVATISYTGTSVTPDVGAAVVPPMVVTVVAVPVAEHGDFDPTHAVVTGP